MELLVDGISIFISFTGGTVIIRLGSCLTGIVVFKGESSKGNIQGKV